jgi:general stress protein 26
MADTLERVRGLMAAQRNVHVLATADGEGRPYCRWMGALLEDPNVPWTFYLACDKTSRKTAQIAANPHAQLLFTDATKWEVATLAGIAVCETGQAPRQWLFAAVPAMTTYYSSPADPALGVIKFTTRRVEFYAMHEKPDIVGVDLA